MHGFSFVAGLSANSNGRVMHGLIQVEMRMRGDRRVEELHDALPELKKHDNAANRENYQPHESLRLFEKPIKNFQDDAPELL